MTTTSKSSGSVLPSLAKHERDLLARLEASKQEAKNIVDQARADARKHLQTEESELNKEVTLIRNGAETARMEAFDATLLAAEARLTGVREETLKRVPDVAQSLLGLFMPAASGEK